MSVTFRFTSLARIELPFLLAPMAGPGTPELCIAVPEAGGPASLPCAMLNAEAIESDPGIVRQRTSRPIDASFFCRRPPTADAGREGRGRGLCRFHAALGRLV